MGSATAGSETVDTEAVDMGWVDRPTVVAAAGTAAVVGELAQQADPMSLLCPTMSRPVTSIPTCVETC